MTNAVSIIVAVLSVTILPILSAAPTAKPANNTTRFDQLNGTFQIKTITRDEWLAKEYFGYLCGKLGLLLVFRN